MTHSLNALVGQASGGNRGASDQLFATLYDELHRLARRTLRRQGAGVTLGATTLLHEAFIGISARDGLAFDSEGSFLAYASRAMRGLIIDYARSRQALKRGGGFDITSLPTEAGEVVMADYDQLVQLSDALDELAQLEPALAQIVDLKFFCGFSFGEIAALREVSERTVQRGWERARLYLHEALLNDPAAAPDAHAAR